MRIHTSGALAALLLLPSCFSLGIQAQAGYGRMSVGGDLGYVSGSTTASIKQDVRSAFGLGGDQGAPYARVVVDTGVPQLSVSAFTFSDSGTGTLTTNFGSSPILIAGTQVHSDLDLTNIKATYAFRIPIGPVSVSPGVGVDFFDLSVKVRDLIGIASETVDLNAPIPIGFLRGEAALGPVDLIAEVGYSAVSVKDVDGSFLDVDLMALYNVASLVDVFVGYRSMELKVDGLIDNDSFDTDLTVRGFLVGGGVRF
jgi:hypothetical protein